MSEMSCFTFEERECILLTPDHPLTGNPWVWRTKFFGAFDTVDCALLEQGWYVAYHNASDLYADPQAIDRYDAFYHYAVDELHLNRRAVLFGFSLGGYYACCYALAHPDHVMAMYLDAPVLDLKSCPAGYGRGIGDPESFAQVLSLLGLTEEEFRVYRGNPLDHAEDFAALGIPIILVCGDADEIVPHEENARPFFLRCRAAGGDIEIIIKRSCNHWPHSLEDPEPVVWYLRDRCSIKA